MKLLLDPRKGDIEDDASSTRQRSLLSLAGSLMAEISPVKLVLAWVLLIGLPGLVLGSLPLIISLWFGKLSTQVSLVLAGLGSLVALGVLLLLAWLGWRKVWSMFETSFWSLHALGLQPSYVVGREVIRHVAERRLGQSYNPRRRSVIRSVSGLVSAAILSVLAAWVAFIAWPHTRWTASLADLAVPFQFLLPVIANAILVVSSYFSVAALVWGVADAWMMAPQDIPSFAGQPVGGRLWHIAHLSDVHTVAGPYGFRIESGRSGPRGNQRLDRVLAELARRHARRPLDAILLTGDLTDAGAATEWAAFVDALAPYPQLQTRMIALPGNHDLNVVDRANPARLDLPGSPSQVLRQMRMLSVLAGLQGERLNVIDAETGHVGPTLAAYLAPHRDVIARFADSGSRRLGRELSAIADLAFPMLQRPDGEAGLGIIVLNSNASTHFSFTNALGMVSMAQLRASERVMGQFPSAGWIIALHHHLVEYPIPAKALSERIGTALINGSQVIRRLRKYSSRILFMHGHRHTEWIGSAGGIPIVSAPSPVMEASDTQPSHFFIHAVSTDTSGAIVLQQPEKVTIMGMDVPSDTGADPSM
ncbi:metallophosphoesterase family protein [Aestuariivirga sp.]|jgi:hypothetical protein|uniref:metallophosphoesterase family protein n=1 Tax=Aestuariivirga sp. TaxID=2650926 RepID=UPI003784A8DD